MTPIDYSVFSLSLCHFTREKLIMARIKITAPQNFEAIIQLPSSKSICNRALIINALAGGTCVPENLSDCDDTNVMVQALQNMPETIDIKAAGTAMRFLTAFLSVGQGTHTITGTERMKERPIRLLVDALRTLGAQIEYIEKEGFPPLRITGTQLTGNNISLPGNVSSQYISALLMISPMLENGLSITLQGKIISRPYINLTLQLMNLFGARAQWGGENRISVAPQAYKPQPFYVESDWSAASYWYEITALSESATICLPGLLKESFQGDAQVARLFHHLGVETTYATDSITLKKNGIAQNRFTYDFVNQPDLAQTFVVTCCMKNIPFCFSGLQSLKIKETDRIAALIAEMKKLGYILTENNNSVLSWNGERCQPDPHPVIDTYEDHRMAMAFAPAAIRLGTLSINNPQVVSKSYPHYWNDLKSAGFNIEKEEE